MGRLGCIAPLKKGLITYFQKHSALIKPGLYLGTYIRSKGTTL